MVILNSNINEFVQQFELKKLSESKQYEYFTNYCVASSFIKNLTITSEALDDISIGDGGDWGIDGVIILINGRLITDLDQTTRILEDSSEITARIILTQAKTSTSTDSGDLAKTLAGAENMIRFALGIEHPYPTANDGIVKYREIIKQIYANAAKFPRNHMPEIHVFYAYKGSFQASSDFDSIIESTRNQLTGWECISDFSCQIKDKRSIVELYQNSKQKNTEELTFTQKISLPEVENIDSSYLCLIPFSQFRKLIVDNNGAFREEAFYDNVRAYQGDNSVNRSIGDTIRSGDIALFTALNNGITIIARDVSTVMNKMTLSDYQIVNGCQTCNVIYNNMNVPGIEDLHLSVKVIASKDKDIRDRIILANNSQTAVIREHLLSLLDEQRRIEEYYSAQRNYDVLYYERRSKQYHNDRQIKQWQIVTIGMQITSFIAMILGKPGQIRGYYGQLLENFNPAAGIKVFDKNNAPALYFLSAYAYIRMVYMFQTGVIPKEYKSVKFFILYAFRRFTEPFQLKSYADRDKNVENYCEHICKILFDNEKCKEAFRGGVALIREHVLHREPNDSDRFNQGIVGGINQVIDSLGKIQKK